MIRQRIRRHPIAAFVLVAFGWTWGWYVVFFAFNVWDRFLYTAMPPVWGPLVGAVAIAWAGESSIRSWFARRLSWRVRPALFLLAVALPLLITNLQPVIEAIGGGSLAYDPPAAAHLMVVWVLVNVFVWGGTEEIGWRGVLQPRLQRRTSVFTAGIAIGLLWWLWHLPLFFTGDPNYSLEPWAFAAYGLFIVGVSTVLAALVNASGGSVLPAMVLHGTSNLGAVLAATGGLLAGSPVVPIAGALLWWLIAGALLVRYGRSMVPEPSIEPIGTH